MESDAVGLLLERQAGGRDGGVGQDVGPLGTFEDEMVGFGPTGKSGKHPTPKLTTPHPTHTHASLKEPVHGQNENIAN